MFALRSRSQGLTYSKTSVLNYSKTSVEGGISTLPTLFLVLSHWTVCISVYVTWYDQLCIFHTIPLRIPYVIDWLYSLHGMHVFTTFLSFAIPIPFLLIISCLFNYSSKRTTVLSCLIFPTFYCFYYNILWCFYIWLDHEHMALSTFLDSSTTWSSSNSTNVHVLHVIVLLTLLCSLLSRAYTDTSSIVWVHTSTIDVSAVLFVPS